MPIAAHARPRARPGTASVIESYGEPAHSTSVQRLVYAPGGKLLSDVTWYSNYRAVAGARRASGRSRSRDEAEAEAGAPAATTPAAPAASTPAGSAGCDSCDSGPEPVGRPRRAQRGRVDRRVRRPAVGDHVAVALDRVLEAEARAAHVEAAGVDEQPVVEDGRSAEARRAPRARATRSPRRAGAGSRPRTRSRNSTRATSNQTR